MQTPSYSLSEIEELEKFRKSKRTPSTQIVDEVASTLSNQYVPHDKESFTQALDSLGNCFDEFLARIRT